MMDMNLNLDVTMGSAGHIVEHHGRGIYLGFVKWTIWILRSKDMGHIIWPIIWEGHVSE